MLFGWDVSTSVIGVTALSNDGKWRETTHFDFAKVEATSLHDKMRACTFWVEEFLEKYVDGDQTHYFEDKLANFSFGRTSMNTLMVLAAFNALFSYEVVRLHLEIGEKSKLLDTTKSGIMNVTSQHVHPNTVKAIMKKEGLVILKNEDKKQKTLEYVQKKVPDLEVPLNRNGKPHKFNFDRADSYIIARSGFLRNRQNAIKAKEVKFDQSSLASAGEGTQE